jgi:hypothetical protein
LRIAIDQFVGREALAVALFAQFTGRLHADHAGIRRAAFDFSLGAAGAGANVEHRIDFEIIDERNHDCEREVVFVEVMDVHVIVTRGRGGIVGPLRSHLVLLGVLRHAWFHGHSASAPEMISISSFVIIAWRVRL